MSTDAAANVASRPPETATDEAAGSAIAVCESIAGLAGIARSEAELVIWRRRQPAGLQNWLGRLDITQLPDLRLLVAPRDLRRALTPLLDDHGMPPGPPRDLLVQDIDALVAAFAAIVRSDTVDVRLERIAHDGCWRFHRDCVAARLLTTYRGPATEWVQPRYAAQALRAQTRYAGPLEQFRIHDVAIFKGSRAGDGRGIVHRSPPVAKTGEVRMLLCLNAPSAASPLPWRNGS